MGKLYPFSGRHHQAQKPILWPLPLEEKLHILLASENEVILTKDLPSSKNDLSAAYNESNVGKEQKWRRLRTCTKFSVPTEGCWGFSGNYFF